MSSEFSVIFSPAVRAAERSRNFFLNRKQIFALIESGIGFGLIMATVWTRAIVQRRLFWTSAAYFVVWFLVAVWRRLRGPWTLPPIKLSAILIVASVLLAASMLAVASATGTLHGLFGVRDPLRHATGYLVWAVIQQIIQQTFFLPRFEQLTHRGLLATFITAALFAVAHIPNPVLVPVTFVGGWILSELYRRYRTVLALGIAHGTIGIAIACSFPDHLQHHMRVGLSYLTYISH
jgi:membrane protease YdiL (CAAX protease family)